MARTVLQHWPEIASVILPLMVIAACYAVMGLVGEMTDGIADNIEADYAAEYGLDQEPVRKYYP